MDEQLNQDKSLLTAIEAHIAKHKDEYKDAASSDEIAVMESYRRRLDKGIPLTERQRRFATNVLRFMDLEERT